MGILSHDKNHFLLWVAVKNSIKLSQEDPFVWIAFTAYSFFHLFIPFIHSIFTMWNINKDNNPNIA